MDEPARAINLQGVCFAYGDRVVFNGLDFAVSLGERVGLLGPVGCGKTTLFHIIVGLLQPQAGRVEIFGRKRREEADFLEVRRRIGLLFQDSGDQLFSPTVAEDVAFGPLNLGLPRPEVERRVRDTLEAVGLSGYEDRITYQLSGGEKRLAALATILAMQPEILLLDEPFAGLDTEARERVAAALERTGVGWVMISHRREDLASLTSRVVLMQNGEITAAS
ncbi:MAG: ABC transporter ATP-binding protein [Candidatus Lernaella stagnicola]|nr:ABC transporter ATP-binding protein [Candidatus Lernaella stagnicola]